MPKSKVRKADKFDRMAVHINAQSRIHGEISVPCLLALIATALRRTYRKGIKDGNQQ